GCNNLIKSGALPVTSSHDVLDAIGFKALRKTAVKNFRGSKLEHRVLELITSGVCAAEDLALQSQAAGAEVNSALTMLEVSGVIRPQGGGNWTLT
ncbi:MAG TPA: hypothetical protein VHK86_05645, partial [Nitrososphaera sp.]|nr:hypothetical protein [Nitrososphaera sp.]